MRRLSKLGTALAAIAAFPLLAVTAAPAAVGTTAAAAGTDRAIPPPCLQRNLATEAQQLAPVAAAVILIRVDNIGDACTVDRFPSITFGDLDGSARPVPPADSARHKLDKGATVYAALRTEDRTQPPKYVPTVTVAADPALTGTTFTAEELGAPSVGVAVYDPVTTWWHPTVLGALLALPAN